MEQETSGKDGGADVSALADCAQRIVEQNRRLMRRTKARNFSPATELDYTANGAGILIQRVFEAVSAFDEGCVPWHLLSEMFSTTDELVNALKLRPRAPVAEIDAAGVAFRECTILWCDTHSPPRMARDTYLKRVFAGRDSVFSALRTLHAAYVRVASAKGRRRDALSAASAMRGADGGTDARDRSRIFAEIDRLRKRGLSIPKAIRLMMHGSYAARMRGVKPESWRNYYTRYCAKRRNVA